VDVRTGICSPAPLMIRSAARLKVVMHQSG
jgi:hypothetical protein